MTVKELVAFLCKQPQDLVVLYRCYSEQALLECHDIEIQQLCLPRTDGWVQNARPDKPTQPYLVFPGN